MMKLEYEKRGEVEEQMKKNEEEEEEELDIKLY